MSREQRLLWAIAPARITLPSKEAAVVSYTPNAQALGGELKPSRNGLDTLQAAAEMRSSRR